VSAAAPLSVAAAPTYLVRRVRAVSNPRGLPAMATLSCRLAVAVLLLASRAAAAQSPPAGSFPPLERAIVPIAGGDTDIGFGGGFIGHMARPSVGGPTPFRWKLEGALLATFKLHDGFELEAPFQDAYLMYTRAGLLHGLLRLEFRAAFTRETNLRYYGLGNASVDPPGPDQRARDMFTRTHPAARIRARIKLDGPMHVVLGTMYIQNWLWFGDQSQLLLDASQGTDRQRDLLQVDRQHGLHVLEGGLVIDTRDDEVSPSRGAFHTIEVRASPWQTPAMPYRYIGISGVARMYVPVIEERLVAALRVVGDIQLGDVPFYELSRFDETSALGGSKYVRGVPSNRYWGKRKLLANLEVRSQLYERNIRGSRYELGFTAFLDSGRVWADSERAPELDGTGLGLKYGVGGGLRLQKDQTFVLRADLAWSPDAHPLGGYFLAGHLF
jgi:hypothetical protein